MDGGTRRSVTILSCVGGNLGSLRRVFERLGAIAVLTDDPAEVRRAQRLLIPGVGAFDPAIDALRASGLVEALEDRVRWGAPVLGICLGMQLLANSSDEGSGPGLGWIPATARRLSSLPAQRVPHLGWNSVRLVREHPLLTYLEDDARFYFSHSYRLVCNVESDIVGMTSYCEDFPAIVQRDNVLGVQFHPEKSHRYGQDLLGSFLQL